MGPCLAAAVLALLGQTGGDLPEVLARRLLRVAAPPLVDDLPRGADPRRLEEQRVEELADRLGVALEVVRVPALLERLQLIEAGQVDLAFGSISVTTERARTVAFSRPIRFVRQLVVVHADERGVKAPADLAGREVTVRASSAYAGSLEALAKQAPGLRLRPAPEEMDTFALLRAVAAKREAITVADSDLFEAVRLIEPALVAPFALGEKEPIAFALSRGAKKLKASLDAFLVEKALTGHTALTYAVDLAGVREKKVLRVLTRNASHCFFLYRGEAMGFEFELARKLAEELGVRLEIVVAPSREALFTWLEEGRGDLIAAGLTVTAEREQRFAFTAPYLQVSELVVLNSRDKSARSLADLRGRTISVRRSSSYRTTLEARRAELGYEIASLPEEIETEDALDMVGRGELFATVADSSILDIERSYGDRVRSLGALGPPRDLAWAMRKDQPELREAASAFLRKIYRGLFYNLTVAKYFKNEKSMRAAASDERSDREGALSAYDELTKKYARMYELDWRLVTAQMYQESRFDPAARSWVGALGLMQVMPQTAQELRIRDVHLPEPSIHAGVKLLARYAKLFADPRVLEKDRLRFALAAYNCGPGHVMDARVLARELGLDPDRWFGNVERAMLLLERPQYARRARYGYCRCSEPVKYVSEIQSRYDQYSRLVGLD